MAIQLTRGFEIATHGQPQIEAFNKMLDDLQKPREKLEPTRMAKDIGNCLGAEAERHHEVVPLVSLPLAAHRNIHCQNQMAEVGRKRPIHQSIGEIAVHHVKL